MCGYEPIATKKKIEIGDYCHELLRAHYLREDLNAASEAFWKKKTEGMFDEEEALYKEIRVLAEAVAARYIETFSKADDFNVLAAEETAYAIIPTATGRPSKVRTQAKIDLVVEDRLGIWFWEHKFTEDFKGREEDLPIDNQLNMYYWTVTNMFKSENAEVPLAGCVLNMCNPRLPSVPELLKSGKSLSKDKRIFTDEKTYLDTVLQHGFDPADYEEVLADLRNNPRPFFQRIRIQRTDDQLQRFEEDLRETAIDLLNRRNIYRNANFMCKRDCFYCQACVIDVKGGDAAEYLQNNFKRRGKQDNSHLHDTEQD